MARDIPRGDKYKDTVSGGFLDETVQSILSHVARLLILEKLTYLGSTVQNTDTFRHEI